MDVRGSVRVLGMVGLIGFVSPACGSSEDAVETGRSDVPQEIDAALAADAAAAGIVTAEDLSAPADAEAWEEDGDEADDEVAACLGGAGADGDPGVLAVGTSPLFRSDDDRGPTLVSVSAMSETVAYTTAAEAEDAFAQLDAGWFAECIAESTEALATPADEEWEAVEALAPGDIEIDERGGVDAGDDAVSLLATFDVEYGEGDDNWNAAELHAVRVGPVIELVVTTRSGEDQGDDVVDAATLGLTDVVIDLASRVTAALGDG